MHYKRIISISILVLSFNCNLIADKFDNIKVIENKANEEAKNISMSSLKNNTNANNFEININNIYNQTQKNVEIEKKRIMGEENKSVDNMTIEKSESINIETFLSNNKIYIFMSESVPLEIWYTYGKFMHDKKLSNTNMVLRGCIGGNCTYIKPTADFILSVKKYNKSEEINPNIIIDPMLFRKYDITRAPCVVYAENVQIKDIKLSEGNDENFKSDRVYKSCGDWNLLYHLREIQKQSDSFTLKKAIDYLENNQ